MDRSLKFSVPSGAVKYAITVVIPTCNRASALISCLEHLEQQTDKNFEVVVVDDGSTDDTALRIEEYQERTTLELRFLQQPNGGPARARNTAIAAASSPLILMIGDDIFASPALVEIHLKLHQQRPESHVAGLGLTLWEQHNQKVTRFMLFLEEGTQFSYQDLIAGQKPTGGAYFYTSNLSVKTEVLRRNPFCERFPDAAFEDLELGYRIAHTEGLELVFLQEALAYHYHPTTFVQACRRMRKGGWSAHLMYEIWPEAYIHPAGQTAIRRVVRRILAPPPVLFAATQFSALLSQFFVPRSLFRAVIGTHFYVGYRDREAESRLRKDSNRVAKAHS